MQFSATGIVPGTMQGEQRIHAAVPIANAAATIAAVFILNVKTPAGRARIGAGAAVNAGKGNFLPEFGIV